ncbi:TIGR03621 family F420-dependent LLM class oxidoreductase [Rhodococcus sp. CX]|uniref:TIGR03621 family F420-dependent LLM class oxidoreductase n=2 Tax=unclassified Rhodococcus (in: high G+C Gram-positive bacteria) TaxID=192944 RepID=UPI0018CF2694|nr:TIGR03621 family F420-dependent LLM class oxidoreductase [Rhodococcus sp. CX]MBH0121109.1 TIGR03621 family F420-dependent LLM class oxidoreductase [Rhodococcus sp. CX]
MPRFRGNGDTWVSEVRRLESMGFDTVSVSEHVTRGWQLSPLVAMAYAAASTTRLRVLSLTVPNDLHHPALLAKEVATVDVLSGGRVELGIGAGWEPADCTTLGHPFYSGGTRVARLAESLEIIRRYFTTDTVDFVGEHYRIDHMEALPRCVQQPSPPILVGAGGPRMLDLAGRTADIVGLHARMDDNAIDDAAVTDLTAVRITEKVDRVRSAAAAAGRPPPTFQFSCYHVDVTDFPSPSTPRSSWAARVEAHAELLKGSPAVLTGTAARCADQLREWRDRFGITYWNLGRSDGAAARIIEQLDRSNELAST